jgi:ribosomal protein L13
MPSQDRTIATTPRHVGALRSARGRTRERFFERIDADVDRAVRGMIARAEELRATVVSVRVWRVTGSPSLTAFPLAVASVLD